MTRIESRLARLEKAAPARLDVPTSVAALPTPNVIEFITSPQFLNQPLLYPRQATLLKILTLSSELLTPYDFDVIGEWETGFTLIERDGVHSFEGNYGMAPGTVDRMQACRDQGREWFREAVLVFGRRGGKGFLTARLAAYTLWRLLALGNPQTALGIDRNTQLVLMTMAADLAQATNNVHRDLVKLIQDAPCFQPYLGAVTTSSLRLRTPADIAKNRASDGSVLIEARPATASAGRGPTAFGFLFDEMAYAPNSGLQRGADEIYRGATPALSQFPITSLTVLASSPASQTGEFYAAYLRALRSEDGHPADPNTTAIQLPSWAPYEDWERTQDGLAMYPGGPDFTPLDKAIVSATQPDVVQAAKSNYDTYRVEYLALWRTSESSYLNPDLLRAMFGPYRESPLPMQDSGLPHRRYVMHCDPSSSGANFGIAIGHLEDGPAPQGHIVFDHLRAFTPQDFPENNNQINYPFIYSHLKGLIERFRPASVTVDQHNAQPILQELNNWATEKYGYGQLVIEQRAATASRNWDDAERFKTLLGERRIHAPHHQLALNELLFLELHGTRVDHPSSGLVRTKDLADAMFNVTAILMDGSARIHKHLSAVRLQGAQLGGLPTSAADRQVFAQLSEFRRSRRGMPPNPARGGRFLQ